MNDPIADFPYTFVLMDNDGRERQCTSIINSFGSNTPCQSLMLTCQEVVTEDGCRTIEARMSGGSPTYYYKYNNPNNLNTQYEADGLRVIRVRYPISNYTYKFSVWDGEETPNSQTPILECKYTISASSNDLCTIDPDGSGGPIPGMGGDPDERATEGNGFDLTILDDLDGLEQEKINGFV